MLSVIIATQDSERLLLPTLAALIPGATEGLVSEVIVADAGSRDETAFVAEVAGCNFLTIEGTLGERLKTAAAAARARWLLFLQPGVILDTAWIGEARRFAERQSPNLALNSAPNPEVAVFRRGAPARPRLSDVWELLMAALGAPPHPDQGLLIAHAFYDALGGHRDGAADAEADLIRRIGRHHVVTLGATASRIDT